MMQLAAFRYSVVEMRLVVDGGFMSGFSRERGGPTYAVLEHIMGMNLFL